MYRAVEAGGGENEGRVVGESTDVDVVPMDVLEIPYHLCTIKHWRMGREGHDYNPGGKEDVDLGEVLARGKGRRRESYGASVNGLERESVVKKSYVDLKPSRKSKPSLIAARIRWRISQTICTSFSCTLY